MGSDARRARVAVRREGDAVLVEAPAVLVRSKAELWVGVLRAEGGAEVARGENAGRTLRHGGIVRTLVRGGTVTRERGASYRVVVGSGVAFLQEPGLGVILGAGRK